MVRFVVGAEGGASHFVAEGVGEASHFLGGAGGMSHFVACRSRWGVTLVEGGEQCMSQPSLACHTL